MDYNASVYNDNYTLLEQLEEIKSILANINPEQITELSQQVARALKAPLATPAATELVAVDDTNSQKMLEVGSGLSVTNGTLAASRPVLIEWSGSAEGSFRFDWNGGEYYNVENTTVVVNVPAGEQTITAKPGGRMLTVDVVLYDEGGDVLDTVSVTEKTDTVITIPAEGIGKIYLDMYK